MQISHFMTKKHYNPKYTKMSSWFINDLKFRIKKESLNSICIAVYKFVLNTCADERNPTFPSFITRARVTFTF